MGERVVTPQSSGGENDTLGEVIEDQFQGHTPKFNSTGGTYTGDVDEVIIRDSSGAYTPTATEMQLMTSSGGTVLARGNFSNLDDDGVNGTPRTGLTTRPKEFTEGASYIIVMLPV